MLEKLKCVDLSLDGYDKKMMGSWVYLVFV